MNATPTIEQLQALANDPLAIDTNVGGVTMAQLARDLVAARREAAKAKGQVKTLNQALQGCREMLADAVQQGRALVDTFQAQMMLTETAPIPAHAAIVAEADKRLAMWDKAALENVAEDPLAEPENLAYFCLNLGLMVANAAGADCFAAFVGEGKPTAGIILTNSPKATAVLEAARDKIESYQAAHDHPKRSFERKGGE